METTISQKAALKGGEFLIRETLAADVFIPEEFSEEQQMMAEACMDFIQAEIVPNLPKIDSHEDESLVPALMTKAGELGLLGISVPEEYGGLGMSFNTSMLIADMIGYAGSFGTSYGAHTGIGTLPILYYGTEEQKQKYVTKLATGEWKASYCLTEPDAGSDANSGKTRARLSEDGTHYLITGQKMWITNAGFADIFIVFAKIDQDANLTAFLVEKDYPGVTLGEEEHKLGIKGSSTRQVFFNDTPVPLYNMLGEREGGFKIAVNILNIGRIKLSASAIGGAKDTITKAVQYANERKQFGQSIANYGAIQYKLAEMAIRTYASESAAYRAGQNIEDCIADLIAQGMNESEAKLKGTEQFAIECAITKVHGSEALDYVVDEGVQIYGGMGFSEDAPMARHYRDSRIARIYEGTNEINRMLLVGMTMKRAMKGQLNLLGPAMAVAKELTSLPSFDEPEGVLAQEKKVIASLKKAILMVAGKFAQDRGAKMDADQEVMMNIADMVIEVYAAESALLRAEKLVGLKGEAAAEVYLKMARVYLYGAVDRVGQAGREAVLSFCEGDDLKLLQMGLKRFTKNLTLNPMALRREIAAVLIEEGKWCF